MELYNDLYTSYSRYFNALKQFGYKKQSDVNKLLVYTFIVEFLTSDAHQFVTEEDYRNIQRALHCLYGSSCLISYHKYKNLMRSYEVKPIANSFRITMDDILRVTESDILRVKE